MKKLIALSVVGLFAASGAAVAGEGKKGAGYHSCGGYGAKTVSVPATVTPKPVKTVSTTETKTKSGS